MTIRNSAQRADHDTLLRSIEWRPDAVPSGGAIDALIVPASRRAHHLRGIVKLAADYGAVLVVLASQRCDLDEVTELVARTSGARAVLAEMGSGGAGELRRLETSAAPFRALSAGRSSDLSLKRNTGLLLALHRGWRKIMFLDDDIIHLSHDHLTRIAHHLDTNRYAGLRTTAFADNSVVCHASREIGRHQGIFVSGAALGVRTADDVAELDVFPDVYNEDWFALAGEAGRAGVAWAGDVGQLEFNPFANPLRAAHEEFGDLLAEGLYALFSDGYGLSRATDEYWHRFIGERRQLIEGIQRELQQNETSLRRQAMESLHEALRRLHEIKPGDCTAFIQAWQNDQRRFARLARQARSKRRGYRDAFEALGVARWRQASFGLAPTSESALVTTVSGRR
jgi:hypothetical protein